MNKEGPKREKYYKSQFNVSSIDETRGIRADNYSSCETADSDSTASESSEDFICNLKKKHDLIMRSPSLLCRENVTDIVPPILFLLQLQQQYLRTMEL